jgi:thiol-disulfide isomerase/thioredoxin
MPARFLRVIPVILAIGLSLPTASAREAGPPVQGAVSPTLRDLSGAPHGLDEHRGGIVVLNFWATWCLPCREEMPIFREISRRYASRGVAVIAASTDEAGSRDAVAAFARELDLSFPVLIGAGVDDMRRLGLGDALPATAILDPDGGVAFRIRGVVTLEDLTARIDHLLGEDVGEAHDPARLVDRLAPRLESSGEAGAPEPVAAGEENGPGRADPGPSRPEAEPADGMGGKGGDGGEDGEDGHRHGGNEAHEHGAAGREGGSLVPS